MCFLKIASTIHRHSQDIDNGPLNNFTIKHSTSGSSSSSSSSSKNDTISSININLNNMSPSYHHDNDKMNFGAHLSAEPKRKCNKLRSPYPQSHIIYDLKWLAPISQINWQTCCWFDCRTIEVSLWYLPTRNMWNGWTVLYIGRSAQKWANVFVQVTFS